MATSLDKVIQEIFNLDLKIDYDFLKTERVSDETVQGIDFLRNLVFQQQSAQVQEAVLMKTSADDTFSLISDLKKSLKDSLKNGKLVQNLITWMFSLTFILGFVLIAFAIYFGASGKEFLATAFGAFGMASIVTLLVKDPPLKMQDSRSNYAQLTLGIIAWLNDMVDKSIMAGQNQSINTLIQNDPQIDRDVKRKANKECIDLYLALSNAQISNTVKLLRIIDEVAEPTKKIISKETHNTEIEVNSAKV